MNKSERIARVVHAVNTVYARSLGEQVPPNFDQAPVAQVRSIIAGVEQKLANPQLTPEQSHQSWCQFKYADGWTYGEKKDYDAKTHPCLLPYDNLPPEQRVKDDFFCAVVEALRDI